MKIAHYFSIGILSTLLLISCTKTESDFSVVGSPEQITISSNTLNVTVGNTVQFRVSTSLNNSDVTAQSIVYVNAAAINGNSVVFSEAGMYAVYAIKNNFISNVIRINVVAAQTGNSFKHNVLVEEFSGTWCGNCPRILYAVDLLHQQTNKAIVVGFHLFGSDPFISSEGNSLAANLGVSGVPTGLINRDSNWTGPQYQNVAQVINAILPSASTGIAINATLQGNILSMNIGVQHAVQLQGNIRLNVYLVEDKLYATQRNYSSNLYGGLASIPNFEYNGVLSDVISDITGDPIANTTAAIEKTYQISLPATISTASNLRIVAFVTTGNGVIVNARTTKIGVSAPLEIL